MSARIALFACLGLFACSSDHADDHDLAAAPIDLSGFVTPMDLSVGQDLTIIQDLSLNADMTPVTCTSVDGTFTTNGSLPKSINTVNTGVAAGALHISMSCAAPTAYTWSIMSGSCGGGAGASNMGRSYDCQLASSSSVTFNITNQNDPGGTATRTFVAF
jgi:hypothetical protein